MADVNDLPDAGRAFATRLLAEVPALDLAVAAAKRLALCLRKKSTEALDDVLAASEATLLAPFVAELRKDTAAVQAALDHKPRRRPDQACQDHQAIHVRASGV